MYATFFVTVSEEWDIGNIFYFVRNAEMSNVNDDKMSRSWYIRNLRIRYFSMVQCRSVLAHDMVIWPQNMTLCHSVIWQMVILSFCHIKNTWLYNSNRCYEVIKTIFENFNQKIKIIMLAKFIILAWIKNLVTKS